MEDKGNLEKLMENLVVFGADFLVGGTFMYGGIRTVNKIHEVIKSDIINPIEKYTGNSPEVLEYGIPVAVGLVLGTLGYEAIRAFHKSQREKYKEEN